MSRQPGDTHGARAEAMATSVRRVGGSLGVSTEGLEVVADALRLAMEPRLAALTDDHHPAYLHPGRTLLVLLRDCAVTDAELLAAAALAESEHEDLRVPAERIEAALGARIASRVRAVPPADADNLLEELVSASEAVRLAALAERLDLVRHAHLLPVTDAWRRAVHAQAESVYLPVAERTDEALARRYRHWCQAFARRLSRM